MPRDPGGHTVPARWTVGQEFRITGDGAPSQWSVISTGARVVEVVGDTPCGRLGLGVRVIGVTGGADRRSRVVFVGRLEPSGSSLRARVIHVPALRRRFDRWARRLGALTA